MTLICNPPWSPTIWTAVLLFVLSVSQAVAESDYYGISLNLTIRSTFEPADQGYQVSLPSPQSWIVNIGNSQNLRDVPCSEEPVLANSAVHIAARVLLRDEDRALLEREGVRLTSLHIHALSAGGITTYLDLMSGGWKMHTGKRACLTWGIYGLHRKKEMRSVVLGC